MTREEHIENLKKMKSFHNGSYGDSIRVAIKALEQEPFRPMVEIDLDYVIKQKYIEREVLYKIRAEIEEQVLESLSDGGDDWFTAEKVNECLEIIDKYKIESEKV